MAAIEVPMLDMILLRRTRPQNTKIEMSWGRRAANDSNPSRLLGRVGRRFECVPGGRGSWERWRAIAGCRHELGVSGRLRGGLFEALMALRCAHVVPRARLCAMTARHDA